MDSAPPLRRAPNGRVVTFDDVLDALRSLDAEAERSYTPARGTLRRARRLWRLRGRGGDDRGGIGLQ